jgi:predicted metal-dependent phosphoesterase TrpH
MNYDLHIHSKYSYDSFLAPERIIKTAKKKGLDGVAITDHGTIRGGVETLKLNKDKNFKVIVGAEIKTEYGDVIGLFLSEEIKTTTFVDVLDEIKSQGGLSVLAHPYRQYEFPEEIIYKVDLIEGFNARSRRQINEKAYKLGLKFKKPMTSGSDAHSFFEIGNGVVKIERVEDLMVQKADVNGKETNYYFSHGISVFSEKIKKVFL